MAVQFDLFENPQREGNDTPKYHARVITKDMVTTKNMSQSISKKCTVTAADVSGVLISLVDEIYDALSKGYSVHVDELGYFTLSLKCSPDVDFKHVSGSDIKVRTINFIPEKDFAERFRTVRFERETSHGHHSEKLTDSEIHDKLREYFAVHHFITRGEFDKLTGFNKVKSLRRIRQLIEEGMLLNAGTRYQPVYVKGDRL